MARCAYRYGSGDQCIYTGCKTEGDMCPAHTTIEVYDRQRANKRAKDKVIVATTGMPLTYPKKKAAPKKQVSKVQTAKAIIKKLPAARPGPPRDPTAPWCSCRDVGQVEKCGQCGKPTYATWARGVQERCR